MSSLFDVAPRSTTSCVTPLHAVVGAAQGCKNARALDTPNRSRVLGHAEPVNAWEWEGRLFEVAMASDCIRDGMALELTDLGDTAGSGPVIEIFWSDVNQSMTFSAHRAVDIPLEVLTKFVDAAKRDLPPKR